MKIGKISQKANFFPSERNQQRREETWHTSKMKLNEQMGRLKELNEKEASP